MIHVISKSLASFFIRKKFLEANQLDIYTYCFEFIISTLLFWSTILILAFVTDSVFPVILYYISFYIFRVTIGGYHAPTHWQCYLLSLTTFCLYLFIIHFFEYQTVLTVPLLMLSALIILQYAPIDHPNKPFTNTEFVSFRKRSMLLLSIALILISLLLLMQYKFVAFFITYGITQAAFSLLAAKIHNERG